MKTVWRYTGKLAYKLMRWQFEPIPDYFEDRHVIIGFPHTSNMDTIRAFFAFKIMKKTGHIMIKKEWFFWPLSPILKSLGGIPVCRESSQGVVGQMVHNFAGQKQFLLGIVPQGTRKKGATIKTGFWHIAKEAEVSIICWYLDNDSKTTRWLGEIVPGDDKLADIKKIRRLYEEAGSKVPLDIPSFSSMD